MAKELTTYRVATVQLVSPMNLFGAQVSSIAETMQDLKLVKVSDGIRVFKDGQDGFEDIFAAGIKSVRYKTVAVEA